MNKRIKLLSKSLCVVPIVSIIPAILTSCSNKKEEQYFSATLINLSDESYILDNDDFIHEGCAFESDILPVDPENASRIENVHLWSHNGWLAETDYNLSINPDLHSAHISVAKPTSDLFVIMSTDSSKTITQAFSYISNYVLFSAQNEDETCYTTFTYDDAELPDENHINCEIYNIEQDEGTEQLTKDDFELQNDKFKFHTNKNFYLPIKYVGEPLPTNASVTLTIKFTYSIVGIQFTRYCDINMLVYDKNTKYLPFLAQEPTIEDDKVKVTFKIQQQYVYWTPAENRVVAIIPKEPTPIEQIGQYSSSDAEVTFLFDKDDLDDNFELKLSYRIYVDLEPEEITYNFTKPSY